MNDGIALGAIAHPVETRWWKRLWLWARHRDLRPDALEAVEIEFSTDAKYNCQMHYVIMQVTADQIPDNDLVGWPVVWARVEGGFVFYPKPADTVEVLYHPLTGHPYGFRPK